MNEAAKVIAGAAAVAVVGAFALTRLGMLYDTTVIPAAPAPAPTTATVAAAPATPAPATAPASPAPATPAPAAPATAAAVPAPPPAAPSPATATATAAARTRSFPDQPPLPEWHAALAKADANRGLSLMQAGWGDGKVQPCSTCHGLNGQPLTGSHVPRLSGLSAGYLAKQLNDYASGARRNEMMTQYARLLDQQQRADVALAWSQRSAPATPSPQADAAQIARGRTLALQGDDALMLPACSNCHGPDGRGEGLLVPSIAGQHADYGIAALQDWVEGRRANDPDGVMRAIVAKLSADDRRAAAAYYASLPPAGLAQTP